MKAAFLLPTLTFVVSAALSAMPAEADQPLAGAALTTSSHGQPFCTDRAQLKALVSAQIAEARFPLNSFPSCGIVPDNATVSVIEDLEPRSPYMHVVKARVGLMFGTTEAYTYSVGLYSDVVRPVSPFAGLLRLRLTPANRFTAASNAA